MCTGCLTKNRTLYFAFSRLPEKIFLDFAGYGPARYTHSRNNLKDCFGYGPARYIIIILINFGPSGGHFRRRIRKND